MSSEFQEHLETRYSHRGTNCYELAQRIEPNCHSGKLLDANDLT